MQLQDAFQRCFMSGDCEWNQWSTIEAAYVVSDPSSVDCSEAGLSCTHWRSGLLKCHAWGLHIDTSRVQVGTVHGVLCRYKLHFRQHPTYRAQEWLNVAFAYWWKAWSEHIPWWFWHNMGKQSACKIPHVTCSHGSGLMNMPCPLYLCQSQGAMHRISVCHCCSSHDKAAHLSSSWKCSFLWLWRDYSSEYDYLPDSSLCLLAPWTWADAKFTVV